jgi:hypothetical protein
MEGAIARMLANRIYYTVCLPEVEGMVLSCREWTTSLITPMNKWAGNLDVVIRLNAYLIVSICCCADTTNDWEVCPCW